MPKKRGNVWFKNVYMGVRPDGKKDYRYVSAPTFEECKRLVRELEGERASGRRQAQRRQSVAEYLERWLRAKKPRVRTRTYESYASTIEQHLLPALGDYRLDELTADDIDDYVAEKLAGGRADGKRGGLSATSVRYHLRVLGMVLGQAHKRGLIPRNPVELVQPPPEDEAPVRALTAEQVARLLSVAEGTPMHGLVATAVLTGLRQGELLGLRWADVDLDAGQLHIMQTIQRGGSLVQPPKSRAGYRIVAISAETVRVLRDHRKLQVRHQIAYGAGYQDHGLVFPSVSGRPDDASNVIKRLRTLLEKAKLPAVRFHDLRHTHASLLLAAGIGIAVTSKRMGHSGIGITSDLYSHLTPGVDEAAAAAVEGAVFSRDKQKDKQNRKPARRVRRAGS